MAPRGSEVRVIGPDTAWERFSSPDEAGWSSEGLRAAREYADALGSAAVLVVSDGRIVAEWGDTERRIACHSIRKSLLSALFGQAVAESLIDLSRTLDDLGVDDSEPGLTATERTATVADLLKSCSGVYHPASCQSTDRLPTRGSHEPGAFWLYNNWDFNALGTIYEQCTGTSLFEAFRARIAVPLQMEDFVPTDVLYIGGGPNAMQPRLWFRLPFEELERRGPSMLRRTSWHDGNGVSLHSPATFPPDASCFYIGTDVSVHPCYWFRMSARDLARFGWLYLREGEWRGRQVVPRKWVRESTAAHSSGWSGAGFGYMWWAAVGGDLFPGVSLPEGSFAALGIAGHVILVLPSIETVVVHRMDSEADRRTWAVGRDKLGPFLDVLLAARTG
jgi:CubicO group peptidase (beta-lactamase class C family)